LAELGLLDVVEFVGGVEFSQPIAAHYAEAHGHPLIVADVAAVDYRQWAGVDYLHASPSCKRASVANAERGEAREDIQSGVAVCRALREIRPRVFTLENVRGYAGFDAYARINATLTELGYRFDEAVYNAADYGVPQTRVRLYLRAWRREYGPLPPVVQTHMSREKLATAKSIGSLFDAPLLPWNGWYAAIEDLIPTLPESKFAPWQIARLPQELATFLLNGIPDNHAGKVTPIEGARDAPPLTASHGKHPLRAMLVADCCEASGRGVGVPNAVAPAFSTTGQQAGRMRAVLVEGDAAGDRPPTRRASVEPCFAVKTASGGREHRAWLDRGRVVAMTPRCLARFQSVPDWYPLPAKSSLATTIIGNGCACDLQAVVVLPLLRALIEKGATL
jgi:site-specific DNA-cytosine methylase